MAVKWWNWKMHFCHQDTMPDPPVMNPVPVLFNLCTDPREEKATPDTWVINPMLKIVGQVEMSVKRRPLIPMGTPDPLFAADEVTEPDHEWMHVKDTATIAVGDAMLGAARFVSAKPPQQHYRSLECAVWYADK